MGFAFLGRLATAVLGILSDDSSPAEPSGPTRPTSSSSSAVVGSSPDISTPSASRGGQGGGSQSGLCMLCENGLKEMLWPVTTVESSGTTCASLALDMAIQFGASSRQCQAHIDQWRNTCCGSTPPKSVAVVVPEREPIRHIGPYPRCGVCHNGDYPSSQGMVLTVLYIGSGSCAQFETMGQQGYIPTHMCAPIQYFGYEPCGCGEFKKEEPLAYGLIDIPHPSTSPTAAPSPAPSEAELDDTTILAAKGNTEGFYSNDGTAATLGGLYDSIREDESSARSGKITGAGGLRTRNLRGGSNKSLDAREGEQKA